MRAKDAQMSKAEAKLASLVARMEQTLDRATEVRQKAESDRGWKEKIEAVAEKIHQTRHVLLNIDSTLTLRKQDNAFLLSRKTDSLRQVHAAKLLVETNFSADKNSASQVAENQPLDYESEQTRRKFATSAISLKSRMQLLGERTKLAENAHLSKEAGSRSLLQVCSELYTRTKRFDEVVLRVEERIKTAAKNVPVQKSRNQSEKRTGRSRYSLSTPVVSRKRERIRPIPLPQ